MYFEHSKKILGNKVMKRTMLFLIMYFLSCSSTSAEVHIIYDSMSLVPNGRVDGLLYDSLMWLGPRDWYGSGVQYIGDSPIFGSLLCDSPDDEVGPLYAASEVGISEENIIYAKAHAESSVSTNPMWDYPICTWAGGNGDIWFTLDYTTLSLSWITEGFDGYEDTGWEIELNRLTFTPEGTFTDLVFYTDSDEELSSEGLHLIDLDPAYIYELTWIMGIWSYTPGNHGWAQLSLDLTDLGSPANEPDIHVSPDSYNFGDIKIGLSNTTIVSISNTGEAVLDISDITFSSGSSSDFSITQPILLPVTVLSGESFDIEIIFSPSSIGYSEAVLEISSNDSDESLVEILLGGVGVANQSPLADAGEDQTVYAWIDGIAEVTLDGSGSNDPDSDELTYQWTWTINGDIHNAEGVSPAIELSIGEHTIELVVNDEIDSDSDEVVITVIEPVEGLFCILPATILRNRGLSEIPVILCLPEGITKDQVALDEPLMLYPGGIEATYQNTIQWRSRRKTYTSIFALFDKPDLMVAVPDNGSVELFVVGKLKTGQYFYGSDTVRIVSWRW